MLGGGGGKYEKKTKKRTKENSKQKKENIFPSFVLKVKNYAINRHVNSEYRRKDLF